MTSLRSRRPGKNYAATVFQTRNTRSCAKGFCAWSLYTGPRFASASLRRKGAWLLKMGTRKLDSRLVGCLSSRNLICQIADCAIVDIFVASYRRFLFDTFGHKTLACICFVDVVRNEVCWPVCISITWYAAPILQFYYICSIH